MPTITPPNPAQLARLGDALDENWRLIAKHDPEFASVMKWAAAQMKDRQAVARMLGLEPPPPPPKPMPRASGAARALHRATAKAWTENRFMLWPEDRPPPSEADDIEAAKLEIPHVPQTFIREARWPTWKRAPGRPPISGEK